MLWALIYWFYPDGSWRYEVTIYVETPEGVKTGSAVHKISNSTGLFGFPEAGNAADIEGEAVAVDLGERGVLFGLISGDLTSAFYKMFPVPGGHGGTTPAGIRYYRNIETGLTHETTCEGKPGCMQMVMFEDLSDPTSVKTVNPQDLSATFGVGVSLQKITYEITDEPATKKVEKYMPAYGDMERFMAWFRSLEYNDLRRFGPDSFNRGK